MNIKENVTRLPPTLQNADPVSNKNNFNETNTRISGHHSPNQRFRRPVFKIVIHYCQCKEIVFLKSPVFIYLFKQQNFWFLK